MRRLTPGNFNRRAQQLNRAFENLPQTAHQQFVSVTPIRSGRARRNTDLRGNEIQANYPYSVRLEKDGWSKQAPQGMTEPTIEWIRTYLGGL